MIKIKIVNKNKDTKTFVTVIKEFEEFDQCIQYILEEYRFLLTMARPHEQEDFQLYIYDESCKKYIYTFSDLVSDYE